jgi:hypothetical protein
VCSAALPPFVEGLPPEIDRDVVDGRGQTSGAAIARAEAFVHVLGRHVLWRDGVKHLGPAKMFEGPIRGGDGAFGGVAAARAVVGDGAANLVTGPASGCDGPKRPIQLPLSFSITENMANPYGCQAPIITISVRQVIARGMMPPMSRGTCSNNRGVSRCRSSSEQVGIAVSSRGLFSTGAAGAFDPGPPI